MPDEDVGLPEDVYEFPWFIWRDPDAPLPPVLYHYTSSEGLLGILESGTLWATNPRYMNDASELVYPLQLAHGVVRESLAAETNGVVIAFRDSFLALPDFGPDRHFYVACFCEVDDLLSQWRAYGSGTSGYGIGFDPGSLRMPDGYSHYWWLTKMEYESRKYTDHIATIVDSYAQHLRWTEQQYGLKTAEQAVSLGVDFFTRLVLSAALSVKHPAFFEEQEWRFVHYSYTGPALAPVPQYRIRRSLLVPYISLSFDDEDQSRLPIMEVICGPSPHPELNEAAVRGLLQKHGYANTIVRLSEVPFRD